MAKTKGKKDILEPKLKDEDLAEGDAEKLEERVVGGRLGCIEKGSETEILPGKPE